MEKGGFMLSTGKCLAIMLMLMLGFSSSIDAKFDPPRITYVVNPSNAGNADNLTKRTYYINQGIESSINKEDVLNVYREKRPGRNIPPIRMFIGTMMIEASQQGSSQGLFTPNASAMTNPIIRYKSAMKSDIVVPRLVIDSAVLFGAGEIALKAKADEEFDKVAAFVSNFFPSKLVIEGHTDSDGDGAFNHKLSVARAEAIRQYLVETYEFITPPMVDAIGYGEERPSVPNDTPENKALNRRIEVIVWQ